MSTSSYNPRGISAGEFLKWLKVFNIDTGGSAASGIVSPGTINELGVYAAAGDTISGLTTANDGALITSATGVPSISSTLPSAVQANITELGTLLNLQVDNINIDGNTISSTDTNGNILITPDGTGGVGVGASGKALTMLNLAMDTATTTGSDHYLIYGDMNNSIGSTPTDLYGIYLNHNQTGTNHGVYGLHLDFTGTGSSAHVQSVVSCVSSGPGGSFSPRLIDIQPTYTSTLNTSQLAIGLNMDLDFNSSVDTSAYNNGAYGGVFSVTINSIWNTGQNSSFPARFYALRTITDVDVGNTGDEAEVRSISVENPTAHADHYGVYQESSTVKNYFAGSVGIGTTSPALAGGGKGIHIHDATPELKFTNTTTGSGAANGTLCQTQSLNFGLINRENGKIFFSTNNTARMTVSSSGDVGIGTAAPAAKLDVNGAIHADSISFDSGVNTLNEYEEGSFTPAISATTPGDLSVSYATQDGQYQRVGGKCNFEVKLVFTPTFSTASSSLLVTDFPFVSGTGNGFGTMIDISSNVTFSSGYTQVAGRTKSGTSNFYLSQLKSGSNANAMPIGSLGSGVATTIVFSGSFTII